MASIFFKTIVHGLKKEKMAYVGIVIMLNVSRIAVTTFSILSTWTLAQINFQVMLVAQKIRHMKNVKTTCMKMLRRNQKIVLSKMLMMKIQKIMSLVPG